MGVCYLLGAIIYAYRIPERWIHGKLDIFGHSHQIWHLLVLLGAVFHWVGILKSYVWWHEHDPQCLITDLGMFK